MRFEIKGDADGSKDDFRITELKIIHAKTRARIATGAIAVWMFVVVVSAMSAVMFGQHDELRQILSAVSLPAMMAFGFYLGRVTPK